MRELTADGISPIQGEAPNKGAVLRHICNQRDLTEMVTFIQHVGDVQRQKS